LDHARMGTEYCVDMYSRCDSDYDILDKAFTMHMNLGDHDYLKQVLSYVYVSRDGLTEEEIWSLVRLIMSSMPEGKNRKNFQEILSDLTFLVDGRLCYSHEMYKSAIYKRFIFSSANQIKLHLDMARYFTQLPASPRKLVCLPFHLQIAGIWSKVKNCLTDISNFQLWWTDAFKTDFMNFWASLTMSQDLPAEQMKTGAERPTFDIVDEYVKSLEEYRVTTKPTPSDENVANIVLDIADFLIEFSTLGHEEAADVPASVHPTIPPVDLKSIGVPHVVVEDGRSILWFPTVLALNSGIGTEGTKKADPDEPSGKSGGGGGKAVEDIPMRTTYYFSRWMWIQFPLVAMGNTRGRYLEGLENKEIEQNGRSGTRPKSQESGLLKNADTDAMDELLKSIGFRRPKSAAAMTGSKKPKFVNPNKTKLPEIKFVRKAARSFRRMTAQDEAEAGDSAGKIEQRMIALQDSIQNYREEFDFLFQQKLKLQKRLYDLTGSLVDINKAADSMGQYDDDFLDTGNKADNAFKVNGQANQEQGLLSQLDIMCTRHPPHMPALIYEVEEKIAQDIYLLAEIRKRLFEQHFEHQAHKVGFKEMKDLAATGVEMHNRLLDFRYQMQQKMQENAAADVVAVETAKITNGATTKKKEKKKQKGNKMVLGDSMGMSVADGGHLLENGDKENTAHVTNGADGERSSNWAETWNMISYRTGIIEPEIFFQRLENRATLEGQMALLKKQAESRLEGNKVEITAVEAELEEVSYDVSFAGGKSGDTSQKKKDISMLQGTTKRGKERTENFEVLRKDALKGLVHIGEILGIQENEEDLDKIILSDLTRHIEVVVDVLLEETSRLEAAQDKSATGGAALIDTKTLKLEEVQAVPTALLAAMAKVESFAPRIPGRIPSKWTDYNLTPKEKVEADMETIDREPMKNASLKMLRQEKLKEARRQKEKDDILAATLKD